MHSITVVFFCAGYLVVVFLGSYHGKTEVALLCATRLVMCPLLIRLPCYV